MTKLDKYVFDDEFEDQPVEPTNAAPDWGHRYSIRELWSEIKPGLYMGGTGDVDTVLHPRKGSMSIEGMINVYDIADIAPEDFEAVVTMYAWARPVDWFVEEYRWGIFDSRAVAPDIETVRDVVVWAHKRWKADKKTLIRCQAGLSRSGFITTLVLVRDGMEVQEAIDLIRKQRSPRCLSMNGSSEGGVFTKMLTETPVEYWRD